jgi:disease resistance protein RPS2
MREIMGSGEVLVHGEEHSSPFRRFDKLRVLVLKKLPNLKSIYSGRLQCNSLAEITVGDILEDSMEFVIFFSNRISR